MNDINEGGASGHLMHPYDNFKLRFSDIKELIISSLDGTLNLDNTITEKTDGQNMWFTVIDNNNKPETRFARNKGESKQPLTLIQFLDKLN